MKLIVGLGNPGEKYENTRHNLGFVVLDHFLKDNTPVEASVWRDEKKFKADVVEIQYSLKGGKKEKIILVKPKTYMNNSGLAVSLLVSFYKLAPEDVWVVHDELDLPVGSMKIRLGGSSAGNRGVESVIQHLGTDKFWRFRLGIGANHNHREVAGQKMHNVDDFVLGKFARGEAGKARELIKRAVKALATALEKDIEKAQNQYNTK